MPSAGMFIRYFWLLSRLIVLQNDYRMKYYNLVLDGEAIFGNIDVRQDFPKYRIYEDGILTKEVSDIIDIWRNDFVSFIIGIFSP